MDGDYGKLNRFLAVAALLGMVTLGLVVAAVANQNGVHDWDAQKVKTVLVDSGTKATAEIGKFFERKPKANSCGTSACER